MSSTGQGNCKQKSGMAEFLGKYTCYVNQPSSCNDLMPSKSNPGEMVSMIPCEKENQEGIKDLSFYY